MLNPHGPGAFEDLAAGVRERSRQAQGVLTGIELRLPVEPDGSGDRKRQWDFADQGSRQAEPLRNLDLSFDLRDLFFRVGVDVGSCPLQLALDLQVPGKSGDMLKPGLIGRTVGPCASLAEVLDEPLIEQAVLGGDFRGRATRDLLTELQRLEYRNPRAGPL